MRRRLRPAGGWPWEQAGYRFSIAWPPGYEVPGRSPFDDPSDILRRTQSAAGQKGGGHTSSTQLTEAMRCGELVQVPHGRGTLGVLSPRSQRDIDRNEQIRRSLVGRST